MAQRFSKKSPVGTRKTGFFGSELKLGKTIQTVLQNRPLVFNSPAGIVSIQIPKELISLARAKRQKATVYLRPWLAELLRAGDSFQKGHLSKKVFELQAARKIQRVIEDLEKL